MERYLPFYRERVNAKWDDLTNAGWANGLYVARAVGACFSKKGKYPDKPMPLIEVGPVDDEAPIMSKDLERFLNFAAEYNRAHPELEEMTSEETEETDNQEDDEPERL